MMFNRILNGKEVEIVLDYIYKINPKLKNHYTLFSKVDNEFYTLVIDTTQKEYAYLIDYVNYNK